MIEKHKWQLIESVAHSMGVPANTIRQWKARGVPHHMHIKILQATAGKITADDLMKTRDKTNKQSA